MSTCLVVGDIGGAEDFHLGDEAMLEANVAALRAFFPGIRVVASSRDPLFTEERYRVRALAAAQVPTDPPEPCWDADEALRERTGWLVGDGLVSAMRDTDALLVSGGGNLCSSWPDKLLERVALLHCATDLRKPAAVVGQTLGPTLTPRQRAMLGAALARAGVVGVREEPSAELARALGVPEVSIRIQVDDAFLLEPEPVRGPRAAWIEEGPFILLTLDPAFSARGDPQRLPRLAPQLDALASALGAGLVFAPHVSGSRAEALRVDDTMVGRELARALCAPLRVLDPWSPREVRWLTQRAALVVSSRYHGLVFATAAAVPALGIHTDEYTRVKLRGALAHAGLEEHALDARRAVDGGLVAAGRELWRRRDDTIGRLIGLRGAAVAAEQQRWMAIARTLALPPGGVSAASLAARAFCS